MIFIDCIHVKIREGNVANRPIYVALGVTVSGERDILGLWAGEHGDGDGAKYWLRVLTEIKNRGTQDVLMVVCDGLKRLPDAVNAVWDKTIVQTCVVHLLGNSFRYASRADWAAIVKDVNLSTPHHRSRPRWTGSPSSPTHGNSGIRRSSGSGPTPGPSSCRSWLSTWRSARSSVPPTPSSPPTPGCVARSTPAATSRPSVEVSLPRVDGPGPDRQGAVDGGPCGGKPL